MLRNQGGSTMRLSLNRSEVSWLLYLLRMGDGKMYCMVLDNAPWHKKAIRLIWEDELPEYQDIRDKMTYISMPPYSPDLNPIEQVWRITRREMTHNRYFPSRIALEEKLDAYYSKYRKPNAKLASLCSFKCFRDEQVLVPV